MSRTFRLVKVGIVLAMVVLLPVGVAPVVANEEDDSLVALGEALFLDPALSVNGKQSCASCHAPEVGFTGPDSAVNAGGAVYQGALERRFGNRRPPTSTYAGQSPQLHYELELGEWAGGMFWDGRATGHVLGDALVEQAQGPFLNPLEQALPNARLLAVRVANSDYADLFERVWRPGSIDVANDVDGTFERIARSIAAYEESPEVNPYSSKFDLFWDNATAAGRDVTRIKSSGGMGGGMGGGGMGGGGMDPDRWQTYRGLGLTDTELLGLAAFNDPNRANCAACHTLTPGEDGYPLLTNFGYHNIGVPKNPDNPFYDMPKAWNPDGTAWVDEGLGGYLRSAGYPAEVFGPEIGKFKVPTLRNVDLRPSEDVVKAYGHNGFFKSLDDIVLFYHWRAMMDSGMCGGMGGGMGCEGMATMFPSPEVDQNRAAMGMFPRMDTGNIVAFLRTLSDGYFER
ncbi:MAG: hypothetical protein A2V85_09515 [Chloroflexi bacterium RBG_16_72_14]|nr:MAG: hypothetical protein A2V85_09515 [Chloroflexi bacterium RBG_16_72_14]